MFKRSVLVGMVLLTTLLLAAAAAAQPGPAAPDAARVRVAHLAPFPGSDTPNVAVHLDGTPLMSGMAYGEYSNYQTVPGGAGEVLVEVLRDGSPVLSETVTLLDGDTALVVIGDEDQVPLDLLVLDENLPDPGATSAGLRFVHVAAIGATIEATRVDVCNQEGVVFNSSANGLRYNRTTSYRVIPPGDYDLKVTRTTAGDACTGALLIDPPIITLAAATRTSVFLVGDGVNQTLAIFTFAEGLIGDEPPQSALFLPAVMRQK
jgi:hypothetical protein